MKRMRPAQRGVVVLLMTRIMAPALGQLSRWRRHRLKSPLVPGSALALAQRVPGKRQESQTHRPLRRPVPAGVIGVGCVTDDPPGAEQFALDPSHDLAL